MNLKDDYFRYQRYFVSLQKNFEAKKFKSLAWLSLSFFAIAFFAITAIRPTLVTIAQLTREIKEKESTNVKLQAKIVSLIAAQKEYARYQDLIPLLNEALPDRNEFPRLVYFLEETAGSSAVTLKSMNLEKIKVLSASGSKEKSPSFNFSVNATGSYTGLKNFLQDLQLSRRIIKIKAVTFTRDKTEDQLPLSLDIVGQAAFEGK